MIDRSDYTIDNLLTHLKALRALGLWNITWDDIATLLGLPDPELAVIAEIDNAFFGKLVAALSLSPEAQWSDVTKALRLQEDASFAEVVDALYEKKHEEELARAPMSS